MAIYAYVFKFICLRSQGLAHIFSPLLDFLFVVMLYIYQSITSHSAHRYIIYTNKHAHTCTHKYTYTLCLLFIALYFSLAPLAHMYTLLFSFLHAFLQLFSQEPDRPPVGITHTHFPFLVHPPRFLRHTSSSLLQKGKKSTVNRSKSRGREKKRPL